MFSAVFTGTEFAGDSFLQKVKLEIVVSKDQVFLVTGSLILPHDVNMNVYFWILASMFDVNFDQIGDWV